MRYFQKLLCLLILVLAASFGVGGCVLLYSDFSVQRSRMAAANAAAHAQACTLLQTEILDLQRRGISTGDAALTARVTAQDVPAALWRGDTLVCATLEGLQSLPLGDAATVTVRTENFIYAVYASDLQGGLRLVTAYDLTGLYRDRNAALMRFLLLEAAVLAAASAVTALLARRLTRPLAVLTDAGAQIAAGDYARRTDLHTGDEIEALSRSFDKMADAVQEKIADLEADVQRREDFVGAFTHELKTPMTSIIGYADMLHTMQTDPDEQREAAAAIVHEGRRLEALSRKLLALLVGTMLFMALIVSPFIMFIYLHCNPYPLVFRCLKESGLTAFFTRSSAANIPVNMALCEKLGLDKDMYSVSIPLGATINMDGAAITITIMTLAAANTLGIQVSLPAAIVLSAMSALGACGASGVAGGSLLLIPMACSLFGISNDVAMQMVGVGFIIGVVQDSVETALNSAGDVEFAATAEYHQWRKQGKALPGFLAQ